MVSNSKASSEPLGISLRLLENSFWPGVHASVNEVGKCPELPFPLSWTPTSQLGGVTALPPASAQMETYHAGGSVLGEIPKKDLGGGAAPREPRPGKEGLEFSQIWLSNYSSTSHSPIISQKGEIYLLFKAFLSLSCYKAHSQSLNFDPHSTLWGWHISLPITSINAALRARIKVTRWSKNGDKSTRHRFSYFSL